MFEKLEKGNGIVTVNVSKIRAAIPKLSKATGESEGQATKWLTRRVLNEVQKPIVDQTLNQIQ